MFGRGLEDADHPGIGEVLQAEFHRIHARGGRHEVDLRFAREGVGVVARRAPGADAERMQSGRALEAFRRGGPMMRDRVEMRRAPVAGAEDAVIPEGHFPRGIDPGIDFDDGGGPERVVEKLLLAAPHHLHRPAGGLGQPRGLDRLAD